MVCWGKTSMIVDIQEDDVTDQTAPTPTAPSTGGRVQLALNVSDLEASVAFYSAMFGVEPHKRRPGYANFAMSEPPLKLVLIETSEDTRGTGTAGALNHLGVEVASTDDVAAARQRFTAAGLAAFDENDTTCCYALQDKVWVHDPAGARRRPTLDPRPVPAGVDRPGHGGRTRAGSARARVRRWDVGGRGARRLAADRPRPAGDDVPGARQGALRPARHGHRRPPHAHLEPGAQLGRRAGADVHPRVAVPLRPARVSNRADHRGPGALHRDGDHLERPGLRRP